MAVVAVAIVVTLMSVVATSVVIVEPNATSFNVDVAEWNGANVSTVRPDIIYFAHSDNDVLEALWDIKRRGLGAVVRSGRHQYTGLLLNETKRRPFAAVDVSNLTSMSVEKDLGTDGAVVAIGAGQRQYLVYQYAWNFSLLLPGGSCPTVGISGFVLGGGYGFFGRQFSIASDHLVGADVVTVNQQGEPVMRHYDADRADDAAMMWALRGGGNNRLGVVTKLYLHLPRIPHDNRSSSSSSSTDHGSSMSSSSGSGPVATSFTKVRISYQAASCVAEVMPLYELTVPSAPSSLYVQLVVYESSCDVVAVAEGDMTALTALFNVTRWSSIATANMTTPAVTMSYPDLVTDLAGCASQADCIQRCLTAFPDPTKPTYFHATSVYVDAAVGSYGLQQLFDALKTKANYPSLGFVFCELDPYGDGGAVNAVPSNATAFPHRQSLYHVQCMVYAASDEASLAAATWLKNAVFIPVLAVWGRGSYRNYPSSWLPDAEERFFRGNLEGLQSWRAIVDPHHMFV